MLRQIFEGMFKTEKIDQTPYFYGWLKQGLHQFYNRRWSQGQVLAMAGPKHSGKSLTQFLITEMFGGREAKPFMFMTGRTDFNSELFEAEHRRWDGREVPIARRLQGLELIFVALTGRTSGAKQNGGTGKEAVWRASRHIKNGAGAFALGGNQVVLSVRVGREPRVNWPADNSGTKHSTPSGSSLLERRTRLLRCILLSSEVCFSAVYRNVIALQLLALIFP